MYFEIWILLVAICFGISKLIKQNNEILKSKKSQDVQNEPQNDHEPRKPRSVFNSRKVKKSK